jgi:hydrogenase-4 membrane subunit HyfE
MLLIAAICVVTGLVFYFRNQGICTLDQAKRERRKIINTSLLVLSSTYVIYLLFNYVFLTEVGIAVGLPWESSRDSYMFWK